MASDDAKLFVAGLSDSISEDILRQIFEATGGQVLSVSLPKDRATGRPRGFGFVTLSTPDEAQKARDELDGSAQGGRYISVRPFQADPPAKKPGFVGGPQAAPATRIPEDERKLYIGNLPFDCSQEEVDAIVQTVSPGGVVRVQLPTDADGRKRGFAFVTMTTPDIAKSAVDALQTSDVRGRRLNVKLAQPRGDRPPRTESFGGPGGGGGYTGGGGGYAGGGGGYAGGGAPQFAPPAPPVGAPPRRSFDDKKRKEGSFDDRGGPPRKGGGKGGGKGAADWDAGRRGGGRGFEYDDEE